MKEMNDAMYKETMEMYAMYKKRPMHEVAKRYHLSDAGIRLRFKKYGLTVQKRSARSMKLRNDTEEMYRQYLNGMSINDISAKYGIKANTILNRFHICGIELGLKPSREQMQAKVKMMYEEYRQGATYEQIAEKYGYSTGRNVWRILFKVNDLPRLGRPERRKTIYAREHGSGNP